MLRHSLCQQQAMESIICILLHFFLLLVYWYSFEWLTGRKYFTFLSNTMRVYTVFTDSWTANPMIIQLVLYYFLNLLLFFFAYFTVGMPNIVLKRIYLLQLSGIVTFQLLFFYFFHCCYTDVQKKKKKKK